MRRREERGRSQGPVARFALWAGAALGVTLWSAGCTDVGTTPNVAVAVSLDSVASPSVVAGDTLRDTFGIVRPLHGSAFNGKGQVIPGFVLKYRAIDPGLTVDSLTGIVTADTALPSPVRILVDAGGLQTTPIQLFAVPRPDSILPVNSSDTLTYALRDSVEFSLRPLSVKLLNTSGAGRRPVPGYLVSFAIQYPTDTLLAQLVDDNNRPSRVDTTAADSTAGRRVLIRPARLHPTDLNSLVDSVVVFATAKYHGAPVAGSPVRLVLILRPLVQKPST